MVLATIIDKANNTTVQLCKHNGATAPIWLGIPTNFYTFHHIDAGFDRYLAYWETRLDLFTWACDVAQFNPYTSEFQDGFTGEVLNYDELLEEEYELEELAANA